MDLSGVVTLSAILTDPVFFSKHCFDSSIGQPFKTVEDVPWDIDCARQCKHTSGCLFMVFNEPDRHCLLYNTNISLEHSACATGDLQVYQMHEVLVCEHGTKTADGTCICTDSYVGRKCDRLMEDCSEGRDSGFYGEEHDIFWIKPRLSVTPFQVLCNMEFDKMYLQINSIWDTAESFDRTWQEYVEGFGDLDGSYWQGLQQAYEISNSRAYNLWITIYAKPLWNNKTILYRNFKISDAASGFRLIIDTAEPVTLRPLGDCLSAVNNTQFSTPDRPATSCAAAADSGWWFDSSCSGCNLNGNIDQYRSERGVFWDDGFQNDTVIYTEMVLSPA